MSHKIFLGKDNDMFRDVSIDSQLYYWFISGDQTSTVEWEVVLKEEVDEAALKTAVADVMSIFVNFRSHPVIINGRLKVSVDDAINVPVFKENNILRQLGTAETEGYLFYITFLGRKIFLRLFHGLADGRGSLSFLTAVLGHYAKETHRAGYDIPEPDCTEDISVIEQVMKSCEGCKPNGRFNEDEHMEDVFRFPVDRFNEKDRKWRVFEIDLPLLPLLALSKSNESSVVPVFEAIIGNAIRRNYDVNDKLIIGSVPVDMRPIFEVKSGSNGSAGVAVPYKPALDKYDLGRRAMLLRSVLDIQVQKENIYTGVVNFASLFKQVSEQPYPMEAIITVVKQNNVMAGNMAPYTYSFSYPGKIRLPEKVGSSVESIVISACGNTFPLLIEACEYNGIIRMMMTQVFDSDELARIIFDEISGIIPDVKFIDRGIKIYDRMDIEKLEHID